MIRFLKFQSIFILAALLLCPSIGCKAIYTDDAAIENAFDKDTTFDWVGTARATDEDADHFGYSPKARAIEKHMGVQ